jgi:HEAT repeat protein
VRAAAAESLGYFPRHGHKSIPGLQRLLKDEKPEVRRAAILALAFVGKDSGPIQNELTALSADPDPATREAVAVALAFMGRIDDTTVPILLTAISSKNEALRKSAYRTLSELGTKDPEKVLPGLRQVLNENQEIGVASALRIMRIMRKLAGPLADDVAQSYDKVSPKNRWRIVQTIVALDPKGDRALTVIEKALHDPDTEVRREALIGIMAYRKRVDVVLPKVIEALKDENARNRTMALSMIRGWGNKASKALPEVIRLTKDKDPLCRNSAVAAVGSFTPPTPETLRALSDSLKDRDFRTKMTAVGSLRRMGYYEPEKVLPIMEAALQGEGNKAIKRVLTASLKAIRKNSTKAQPSTKKSIPRNPMSREESRKPGNELTN